MSDKPDNQVPGKNGSADEDAELSEEPQQIWPPPCEAEAPAPKSPPPAPENRWSQKVKKIDEVIDEIAQINDDLREDAAVSPAQGPEAEEAEVDRQIDREIDEALAAEAPAEKVGPTDEAAETAETVEAVAQDVPAAPAGDGVEQIVAAVLEAPPAPEDAAAATVSEARCRVREQSEAEMGRLWGSVFFSAERPAPKAIIVTAARPRDGATQIATALALVGAEASRELRIALVDFNLRSPGIAKVLGIQSEPGLTDVLDGLCSLEAAMHTVTLRNGNRLHVLPSGARVDKPLGLLRSRQVQSLIGRLQDRHDHTVIDVAAANVHPDSQVLGALVDGALFVVKAGETPRETVAEAKKRLDLVGVRCLGVVLNQRSDPIPSFLYRMT